MRRIATIAIAAALLLVGTGCLPVEEQDLGVYVETFEPILIKLVAEQSATLSPQATIAVAIGVFLVSELTDEVFSEDDRTYLLINQTVNGLKKTTVFEIDTQRVLKIDMEGKFEQIVEQNRVTITPDPAVSSTIVVSDLFSGDELLTQANLPVGGKNPGITLIDLDSDRLVLLPVADPERGPASPALRGINLDGFDFFWTESDEDISQETLNGAELGGWRLDRPPAREECIDSIRSEAVTELETDTDNTGWCVRTAEGRYGYLTFGSDAQMGYVVWAEPEIR